MHCFRIIIISTFLDAKEQIGSNCPGHIIIQNPTSSKYLTAGDWNRLTIEGIGLFIFFFDNLCIYSKIMCFHLLQIFIVA